MDHNQNGHHYNQIKIPLYKTNIPQRCRHKVEEGIIKIQHRINLSQSADIMLPKYLFVCQ